MNAIEALRKAAQSLIDDVRRRYPGEDLRCPYMIALDQALSTPPSEAESWKLVPLELADAMRKAWFAELERWGTRHNKGEKLPYEVYRHASDEVVSPVVMERFTEQGEATAWRFRLATDAAYRAMIAAAPAPTEGERG